MNNKQELDAMSPQSALETLLEGNKRFMSDVGDIKHQTIDRIGINKRQRCPIAVIVTCMDSRLVPELIFDQSIGDVLVIRIAGVVINDDILGSLEYACQSVGIKYVMVLGHTQCEAVAGACQDVQKHGGFISVLNKIKPAVEATRAGGNLPLSEWIEKANLQHIKNSVGKIKKDNAVLKKLVDDKMIFIQGAVYNVLTGKVSLLES
ncbi:carbonic anhydrase [bacterium]|nr:carbonic anhydrase [bacterium]